LALAAALLGGITLSAMAVATYPCCESRYAPVPDRIIGPPEKIMPRSHMVAKYMIAAYWHQLSFGCLLAFAAP
jgi:hypothetical protein